VLGLIGDLWVWLWLWLGLGKKAGVLVRVRIDRAGFFGRASVDGWSFGYGLFLSHGGCMGVSLVFSLPVSFRDLEFLRQRFAVHRMFFSFIMQVFQFSLR
jgi:hypothetical protein